MHEEVQRQVAREIIDQPDRLPLRAEDGVEARTAEVRVDEQRALAALASDRA